MNQTEPKIVVEEEKPKVAKNVSDEKPAPPKEKEKTTAEKKQDLEAQK